MQRATGRGTLPIANKVEVSPTALVVLIQRPYFGEKPDYMQRMQEREAYFRQCAAQDPSHSPGQSEVYSYYNLFIPPRARGQQ